MRDQDALRGPTRWGCSGGSTGLISTVVKRGYRLNATRDTPSGGAFGRDVE